VKFVFVADFFVDEILGGGELNNEELFLILKEEGHEVLKIKSQNVTTEFLYNHRDESFVIFNFIYLKEAHKSSLSKMKYVIYEHDHKYIKSRNPADYSDYLAPKSEIVNYDFYRNAKAVFCQSKFHAEIVEKNLNLKNIVNLSGNLWSEQSLAKILEFSKKSKSHKFSILSSNTAHKNTRDAVRYCEYKNMPYDLVSSTIYYDFLDKLSDNKKLLFLPKTPETLSRIVVEARMMNMGVTLNSNIGAHGEDWFELKGEDLINVVMKMRETIPNKLVDVFKGIKE